MYALPQTLEPGLLSPDALAVLADNLELHGSLPFVRPELVPDDEDACEALADIIDRIQIAAARESPAAFVQYAFRHEETNKAIVNAGHHVAWHDFLDEYDRAVLFAPVEHAKSQHIAIGRVLWQLGKYPNKRIAIVSNTAEPHAIKILSSIRSHIETNPRVHKVFPELKRGSKSGDTWGQYRITVERETIAKDPSIQSLGVFGPINGSRLDGIILDDILNFENTRTIEQIDKLCSWLDSEVLTRVTANGWLHWIGTPWVPMDPMHQFAKRKGWAVQADWMAVLNPDEPQEKWVPLWPEQFSRERLVKIYNGTTPLNFARKYLCRVRDDGSSRFNKQWIDHARELGKRYQMFDHQPHGPSGRPWRCFTGVDLAAGKKKKRTNASTVLFTIAIDEAGRKVVANIQAGQWKSPEIILRIAKVVKDFNSHVLVEDNATQAFITQWATEDGLPVTGFDTTAGKKFDEDFGVESLAVEMRNGGWIIPSDYPPGHEPPELHAWIQEMLFYSPEAHTGDRLMASWFARECSRSAGLPIFGSADTLSR